MKKINIILDFIIMGLSIFFFNRSFSFADKGEGLANNSGLFPQLILIAIVIFVLIDIVSIIADKNKQYFFSEFEKAHLIKFFLFILTMILFVFLLKKVPFILLAIGVVFIQCLVLRVKLINSIIISVSLSVSVYFLFVHGLNVIL